MDIKELASFKLSDAVKFHNKLNPKLWVHHKLDSEVREQLLLIAEDFVSTLGIRDLDIVDITISGSNAAYSYTPHSDLDLHIIVNMPKLHDEVYRELFTAKKTLYNDSHDITVHGVPVEVYVQDVNEPVQSLGEYSVTDDKWIHIPKRRRANFDEVSTKSKYENLSNIVELAVQSRDLSRIEKTIDTIRRYRKAGLHKGGEFSPENLAYKAIRSQGGIDALYDLRDKLRSKKLSIEEATSREDAILKIQKLQNTSGRTDAEKETIERVINRMIQQYNITPQEIGSREKIDPLKAKMAAAAYEKAQASAALRGEWDKFKGKFKNIFTETTVQSQHINNISNDLADKIIKFIAKNDRNILNYFKTHDEHTLPLFSEKGKNIALPKSTDTVLNRIVNSLTFEIILNEALPDVPLDKKVKPIGAYYPGKLKIVISVPQIKRYSRYQGMSLRDSLRSTIAHEIVHAVDDAKSYSQALMPKGEYLKLPQEVNARFQEALFDIAQVVVDNRDKLLSYPDSKYPMEYLKYLIKWSFDRNRLSDIYEVNDPRYKRLLSRTYKFYVAELANPVLQTTSSKSLARKALDWLTTKPFDENVSGNIELTETVEESQIVNLVSLEIAKDILRTLQKKEFTTGDFFNISKKARLTVYSIKLKELNIPHVYDPVINKVLDNLTMKVIYTDAPVLARYIPSENHIELNLYKIREQAVDRIHPLRLELTNTIAHELQHAIDDCKSKGKALKKPIGYDKSLEQYLKLNYEINARLQQVLVDISYYLIERDKKDGTPWTTKDLPMLIEYLFAKHSLTKSVIGDIRQYNRLLSRTYKFFDHELKNPKKITKQNMFKRAYNYITGRPTSEIHEDLNDIPDILYHATYRPLLRNIKKTGLGGSGAQAKWEDSEFGVVYLATDPEVAISYAETSDVVPDEWLDEIVVLKIPLSSLDKTKLFIDTNVQDNTGDTLEYHGVIPFDNKMLNEASGYIPSEKEKNDLRFKTALTVDVKPDAIKKNAKAFGFKTTRAGIPPQARADGKINESTNNFTHQWNFKKCTLTESKLRKFFEQEAIARYQTHGTRKVWHMGDNLAWLERVDESKYSPEVSELMDFQKIITKYDQRNKVNPVVGNKISIVQLRPHISENIIELRGFLTPKTIIHVEMRDDHIAWIDFDDGSSFPDKTLYNMGYGNDFERLVTLIFPDRNSAEGALSFIYLQVPEGWEIGRASLGENAASQNDKFFFGKGQLSESNTEEKHDKQRIRNITSRPSI